MARKIALVLAALAIISVANAATNAPTVTAAAFDNTTTPTNSYLQSTITTWVNTLLVAGSSWGAAGSNTTFNTYNLAETGGVVTVNKLSTATDTYTSTASTITGGSACKTGTAVGASGTNTYAYACSLAATGTNQEDIWLSYANAGAASFSTVQLTAQATTSSNALTPLALWFDDTLNYWYVAYRIEDNAATPNTLNIKLQAVNTTDTNKTLLFGTDGVALYTGTGASTATVFGAIGPNTLTNATTATFLYQDTTSTPVIKNVQVTLTGSGSAAAATTVATDGDNGVTDANAAAATPRVVIEYTIAGFATGASNYSIGIQQKNTSSNAPAANSPTITYLTTLMVYTSANTTSGYNYTLSDTTGTYSASISGTTYGEGWSIITSETTSTGANLKYANFFLNGSMNGTAQSFATIVNNDKHGFWLDTNGSFWFGYTTSDASPADAATTQDAYQGLYAGKLFGQVYLFANTLSSVFAFVALMIAAVFAF